MEIFMYMCAGAFVEHFTGIFGKLLELFLKYIESFK